MSKRARSLTPKEIEDCREFFSKMDWNKNGSIGFDDMKQTLKQLGYHPTDQEVDGIMRDMNLSLDKRGSIEENDFVLFMESRLADRRRSSVNGDYELKYAFDLFDNGDGFVSVDSILDLFRNFAFETTKAELEEMIGELKPKNNKKLDFQEFRKLMTY